MNDLPDDLIQTRWSLIQRLKNLDDNVSWQEFWDTYARLIYSVASKSGLTQTEAQEVVQDTILAVSRKIGEFRADPAAGSFGGWLMKLTRWRIADQFRKRARAEALRHHKSPSRDAGDKPTTATEERVADPAGNLLEAVWDEEWQRSVLDDALEKLKSKVKPKHYQIFYLAVVKEMPIARVAKTLGVNAGQVYLVRHRVGKDFKQALKEAQVRMGMGQSAGQSGGFGEV